MRKKLPSDRMNRRIVIVATGDQVNGIRTYTAEVQKAIGSESDFTFSMGARALLRKGIEMMKQETSAELAMIRAARMALRSIADCTTSPVHDEDDAGCGCSSCLAARTLVQLDRMGMVEGLGEEATRRAIPR